ncbi:MAG: hypothetical protein Terrestrivirus5_62 [Terrestrivirus sp.]|uniref:Uncharacterized protein n=1 Tax=Terrestrivirus sp. TaxID=2487775 RepID=A0A3G4ZMZ8_9VIRU|nr:MAG: hypothetical protein Terrestrivirus5_62 [Terrestrivirus sp.]
MGQRLHEPEHIKPPAYSEKVQVSESENATPTRMTKKQFKIEFNKLFNDSVPTVIEDVDHNKIIQEMIVKQKIYYNYLINNGNPKDKPYDISDLDIEIWNFVIKRNITTTVGPDKYLYQDWSPAKEQTVIREFINAANLYFNKKDSDHIVSDELNKLFGIARQISLQNIFKVIEYTIKLYATNNNYYYNSRLSWPVDRIVALRKAECKFNDHPEYSLDKITALLEEKYNKKGSQITVNIDIKSDNDWKKSDKKKITVYLSIGNIVVDEHFIFT